MKFGLWSTLFVCVFRLYLYIFPHWLYLSIYAIAINYFYLRFMESEVELHDVLQELHVVATAPELYPIIIDLNSVSSLIGLLVGIGYRLDRSILAFYGGVLPLC